MKYILKVAGMTILLLPAVAQTADSISFGVEREMKESGEKGGTADINIGIGELQKNTSDQRIEQGDKVKQSGNKPSRLNSGDSGMRRDTY